jgi:hypothetical protein
VAIRDYGRLGGLMRAAMYDGRDMTAKTRQTFRESFLIGHSCKVCPSVNIPAELSLSERQRRADALYSAHYERIRLVRSKKREAARVGEMTPDGVSSGAGHAHSTD